MGQCIHFKDRETIHDYWGLNTYEITFVTDKDLLPSLKEDWQELERRCQDPFSYFQSYDWCQSFCDAYLDEQFYAKNNRLLIVTVRNKGRLVALLPMFVERELGLSVLKFLGSPIIQFSTMLADPLRFPHSEVINCIEALEEEAQCDAHVMSRFIASSALGSVVEAGHSPQDCCEVTSMLHLGRYGSVEEFEAGLSKSTRKNRRRRRNKLEKLGKITFEVIDRNDERFERFVDESIEMKIRWLNETGRREMNIANPNMAKLLKALPGNEAGGKGCVLMALMLDGRPIATEIGFCHYGNYYSFIGAFDWNLYDYSPGKVQIEEGIDWAIEKGIQNYDFLGEPTTFKKDIVDTTVPLAHYNRGITVKGQLFAKLWYMQLLPTVKDTFQKLPTGLRRTAIGVTRSLSA